ncbi:MAG: transposase [Bacteroidetes bacterium]|nr:transposase [Bacteroidota bacterium]
MLQTDLVCPFCHSSKVVKHGKTSANKLRYRCTCCKRTWVKNGVDRQSPDFGGLAGAYLSGSSYRDLRSVYRSSPIRINQKIREYLSGCSSWEEYLDASTPKHDSRLIHLVGKKFKANVCESREHSMYLALAIDALSTAVLGFEIGESESENVWMALLDRMNCRGFVCPTFMSYGFKVIEDALKVVFPYSETLHNFTRTCYDKHLKDEVFHSVDTKKLIREAINAHMNDHSCRFEDYLVIFKDKRMKQIVLDSRDCFVKRLQERISQQPVTRFEGLLGAFETRFEKFHMIKYDPYPIINAWIAWWMLEPLPIGFSRLSLYLQCPCETHFKNFNCGTLPKPLGLSIDSPEMRTFVVELAVRSLQLPVK